MAPVFKSNKRWNAFYRNLKRTYEHLLPWYYYAVNTNNRKNSHPSLATQRVNTSEPLHDIRTVNLAVGQCECHTGKYDGIAKIKSVGRNWATNFMLSRESWCLVSISRGANDRFPPCGRPWSEVMTTFFTKISAKCTKFEVSSLGLELQVSGLGVFDEVSVSVSEFSMKSRSRLEILTRSRSRRLRSRLHQM